MKHYCKPQLHVVHVEPKVLMATSGAREQISIGIDHNPQAVSGCSNQEGFGSIWE